MKKLLLALFRVNSQARGWEKIALSLLENGECIVAGNYDGVSSVLFGYEFKPYLVHTPAPNAIDCTLIKFDLGGFINSKYFQNALRDEVTGKNEEIDDLSKDIAQLNADIFDLKSYILPHHHASHFDKA